MSYQPPPTFSYTPSFGNPAPRMMMPPQPAIPTQGMLFGSVAPPMLMDSQPAMHMPVAEPFQSPANHIWAPNRNSFSPFWMTLEGLAAAHRSWVRPWAGGIAVQTAMAIFAREQEVSSIDPDTPIETSP